MYAACERKPVVATIATSTSRIEPSARRQPRAAQGRAPEARAERAWRGGGHVGESSRRRALRTCGPRACGPGDREARPRRATPATPSTPTRAQRNHSDTTPGASSRTRTRCVGAPGGSTSTTIAPPGASSSPARRSSSDRRAADADVAVEQQDRPPRAGARDLRPQRAVDRLRAAPAGELDRDGREVDAEPALAGGAQRGEVAARAAAEVEHRRLDVGEDRTVDGVGGREPAPSGSGADRPAVLQTRPSCSPPAACSSSRP